MEKKTQELKISVNDIDEISIQEIRSHLEDIVEAKVAVWRKNIDNQLVVIPVIKLEQFLGEKDAESINFYIERNWERKIQNRKSSGEEPVIAEQTVPPMQEVEKYGRVEEQAIIFKDMTVVEREELLDESISRLSEGTGELDLSVIVKMVEVLSSTFYANNANLEDISSDKIISDEAHGVLVKSNWVVQILLDVFEQKKYTYNDLKIFNEISTGSATMDHINKVFLMFISFCMFFNEYIGEGLFTKNIRGMFRDRYHRYYRKKFPDISVTIETIFKDGIRRINKEKELMNYAIGALLFDIGKIRYINYHDGSEPYNHEIVKKHALHGYNMIIKARKYPFEALAMSVFHHEYYGGKGSYNFTKPILLKISGKKYSEDMCRYFISYDKNDFIHGISLAYFPCKVIEILDVYDSLVGKKSIPVIDALRLMKKEYINKSLKIDPILFRIFLEYNVSCGLAGGPDIEQIDSIIY